MFDYGVAFTGFSRVVYSPMFVLGVAFTGYFYLVCSKDHCLENPDPKCGSGFGEFRRWMDVGHQRRPGQL
jgi:hypothetical protein